MKPLDNATAAGPSSARAAASPPPWKAPKPATTKAAGGFPAVEIYTPFGSELSPEKVPAPGGARAKGGDKVGSMVPEHHTGD